MVQNKDGLYKTYFKNFFDFIVIFTGATILFASDPSSYDGFHTDFNLLQGYFVTSFIAVLALGHTITMHFVEGKKRDMETKNP